MKLTELIALAQAALAGHGDLDVEIPATGGCGSCTPRDAEPEFDNNVSTTVTTTTGYAPETHLRLE